MNLGVINYYLILKLHRLLSLNFKSFKFFFNIFSLKKKEICLIKKKIHRKFFIEKSKYSKFKVYKKNLLNSKIENFHTF